MTRHGSLFPTRTAATGKARSQTVDSHVQRTISDDDNARLCNWSIIGHFCILANANFFLALSNAFAYVVAVCFGRCSSRVGCVLAGRVTVEWCVPHRGVIRKAYATSSPVALTGRCLAGQYASSSRSDVFLCGK